jgi:hypothetical protein
MKSLILKIINKNRIKMRSQSTLAELVVYNKKGITQISKAVWILSRNSNVIKRLF